MWLIIVIVILFTGFPEIYASVSTWLHIPLLIMLLGVIARGTAFAFRHYDAVEDFTQQIYNKVFRYSSFITPFFLGIIAASAVSGTINPRRAKFCGCLYIFLVTFFFYRSRALYSLHLRISCGCFSDRRNPHTNGSSTLYCQGPLDEYSGCVFRCTRFPGSLPRSCAAGELAIRKPAGTRDRHSDCRVGGPMDHDR